MRFIKKIEKTVLYQWRDATCDATCDAHIWLCRCDACRVAANRNIELNILEVSIFIEKLSITKQKMIQFYLIKTEGRRRRRINKTFSRLRIHSSLFYFGAREPMSSLCLLVKLCLVLCLIFPPPPPRGALRVAEILEPFFSRKRPGKFMCGKNWRKKKTHTIPFTFENQSLRLATLVASRSGATCDARFWRRSTSLVLYV